MTCWVNDELAGRALLDLLIPRSDTFGTVGNTTGGGKKRFRRTTRRTSTTEDSSDGKPLPDRITILEKLSTKTVSVCWSDSRTGHYADQVWRLGIARISAHCVLTGKQILRGDPVFRPRASETYSPGNKERMMLASAVPESFDESIFT
ncbi:DUF3331 domain-containing protein [Paraburkholderia terrae]|uniref:DUF3331 domain-containing protein n=1 Tax=Paraburkholderia terrae TaxID=311230 RepID=UPI001E35EA7B|nr:DUF3331 domain-containing protein [Paraburkholderia terrae]